MDFNVCGCVMIDLNVCRCAVIDLNVCGVIFDGF